MLGEPTRQILILEGGRYDPRGSDQSTGKPNQSISDRAGPGLIEIENPDRKDTFRHIGMISMNKVN